MSKSAFGSFPNRHRVIVCSTVDGKPYLRRSWFDLQEDPLERIGWVFSEAIGAESDFEKALLLREHFWFKDFKRIAPGKSFVRHLTEMQRKEVWLNGERKTATWYTL